MNLLLYNESKHMLHPSADPARRHVAPYVWHGDELPTLPDSLFEELGYAGALDPAEDDSAGDDDAFSSLFSLFVAPALSF